MTVKKLEFLVNGALCVVVRRDIWGAVENPTNWQGYVGISEDTSKRWEPRLDCSDNAQRKDFFKVVPGGITFDQDPLGLCLHISPKDHNFPRWIGWDSDHSGYWHVSCGEAITHTIALALALTK